MPRQAAEIRLERVHRLDPPRKARVGEHLEDFAGDEVGARGVGLHHDRDLREAAEPHGPARILRGGVAGILGEVASILIEPQLFVSLRGSVPLAADHVLHPGGGPFALLEPLELVAPDLLCRLPGPEREHAVRPAKREGERV